MDRFTTMPGDLIWEDGERVAEDAVTISEQVELSWRDAWLHETRNTHGEWTHGPILAAQGSLRDRLRNLAAHPYGQTAVSLGAFPSKDIENAAKAEAMHGVTAQEKYLPHIAARETLLYEPMQELQGGGPLSPDHPTFALTGGHNITMATDVSNTASNGLADREAAEMRGSGWFVPARPGTSLADTIVAHETGHVAMNSLTPAQRWSPAVWGPVATALGVPAPGADMDSWLAANKPAIAKAVSTYGSTNPAELSAELWSEYTMNASPRPPAAAFGQQMLAQLGGKA
jgi:hypothetical protein